MGIFSSISRTAGVPSLCLSAQIALCSSALGSEVDAGKKDTSPSLPTVPSREAASTPPSITPKIRTIAAQKVRSVSHFRAP